MSLLGQGAKIIFNKEKKKELPACYTAMTSSTSTAGSDALNSDLQKKKKKENRKTCYWVDIKAPPDRKI